MEINNHQSLPNGYVLQGENNRYIIERVLGQGAFGITYLARYKTSIQGSIGKGSVWAQVAIKEFFMRDLNMRDGSTGYLNDSSQDSLIGRYRRAFMREARNLAGLHHDNIVNVFEVIETNNTVYIVMEYINGGNLDEHIAQSGKLSEQESIDSILKLCSAVGCMHEHKMLHLDIKPKNVMLDEDGELYLIDFGLSKQYTADGEPESSTSIGLGTPGYAPVEQSEHQDGDKKFRATIDVYALGATLFKMLTGNTPPKASQVSDSVIDGDNIIPKQLKAAGISNSLMAVVTKAMWPSSSKRYQTVKELEEVLLDIKESTPYQESTVVMPEPVTNQKPEPVINNHIPNPKPEPPKLEQEPKADTPKGFTKWLYAIIAALFVGIFFFFWITRDNAAERISPEVDMNPKEVEVLSITIINDSINLEEGSKDTLIINILPENITNKKVVWISNDTNVVRIDNNGVIQCIKAGNTTIVASCGNKSTYCYVKVKPKPVLTGVINGHEWIDLGLSVKWATCNIGATKPGDYGDYFAWGEVTAKMEFGMKTYKWGNEWRDDKFNYKRNLTKYNTNSEYGEVDNKKKLELSDDAAHVNWGGSWRMPTKAEFDELKNECTWVKTTKNGNYGFLVTGKNGKSIFLPAAGCVQTNTDNFHTDGSWGEFWTSNLNADEPFCAWKFSICSTRGSTKTTGLYGRYDGNSVRPVTK